MAGVEAYAELFGARHTIDDLPQLAKPPADLRALACHRLKEHCGRLPVKHREIQRLSNFPDSLVNSLPDVASGVEIIVVPRHIFHASEIVLHRIARKLERLFLLRAGVQRIGRMRDNAADFSRILHLHKRRRVSGDDLLCSAPSGVAGKKLKGVRADGQRHPSHGRKALGRG